jgi:hypothetical protein
VVEPTAWALARAAQAWQTPETSDIVLDERLARAFARQLDALLGRLMWMSGSSDFAPGGVAAEGYRRMLAELRDLSRPLEGDG